MSEQQEAVALFQLRQGRLRLARPDQFLWKRARHQVGSRVPFPSLLVLVPRAPVVMLPLWQAALLAHRLLLVVLWFLLAGGDPLVACLQCAADLARPALVALSVCMVASPWQPVQAVRRLSVQAMPRAPMQLVAMFSSPPVSQSLLREALFRWSAVLVSCRPVATLLFLPRMALLAAVQ